MSKSGNCRLPDSQTDLQSRYAAAPPQNIAPDYVESGTAVAGNLTLGKLHKALSMLYSGWSTTAPTSMPKQPKGPV